MERTLLPGGRIRAANSRGDREAVASRIGLNRANWNERTRVHAGSDFYDVAGFRAGRITLNRFERAGVGDVRGKSLLHLQCHFGLDTLSWARLGAKATGIDISDDAIRLARDLNDQVGLDARFIRSNIYDLPRVLDGEFDVVYTAMGVLAWLPDLEGWAEVVSRYLKPGGLFYLLEIHPASQVFDDETTLGSRHDLRVRYGYFPNPEGMAFPGGVPSYAGDQPIESPCHEWQHSIGEIITALLNAGLRLTSFAEHPATLYKRFPGMTQGDDGLWHLPFDGDFLPLIFELTATR
ncbi:MAG: class I SAM-dependent methyltransferase [Gammaproteobacteria bacterium]|nr:class I SAM-dependent methyltransferase [Gammaproteobacteria bacterium]